MTATASAIGSVPVSAGQAPGPRQGLWEFVESSGLRSMVACASKNPNAKFTVLLVSPDSGRAMLAIKVPTTDAAARAVEAEGRALVDLHRLAPPVSETIPRLVGLVEHEGRTAIVMSALPGTPMSTSYLRWRHTARRGSVAADFAAVEAWLAQLQQATAGVPAPVDMDHGSATRLGRRFAGDAGVGDDLGRLAEMHGRLHESRVPRTAVHGDLWCGNVLQADGRASGVVDWEAGATSGEPVRDLVRFALMYALFLDRRTRPGHAVAGHDGLRAGDWGAGIEYALNGAGWFPEIFRRFLQEGLARLGASPSSWRDAALAGIAETAADADDDDFARHHLMLFRRLTSVRPGGSRR